MEEKRNEKIIIVLLLFMFISLSTVNAEDINTDTNNTVTPSIINESNNFNDEFYFNNFSQEEELNDDFIDDIPDSDVVFNDSFNLDMIDSEKQDQISGSISLINPKTNIGIQNNPETSTNTKYIEVSNYNQLINAFNNLGSNHDNAIITLKGPTVYTITTPITFGTTQNINNVTIKGMNHIITGENNYHFITINPNYTLTLNDITIQNTTINSNGGAIINKGTLNIYDSTIANNSAFNSGGQFTTKAIYTLKTLKLNTTMHI